MWPWEHLAVGYLLYSLCVRARYGTAPRSGAVVALAVGTQFPDLVDKPLSWTFGVLPTGHSLAHSLFVALPAAALAVAAAAALGRRDVGAAFGFGYLSHLPADAVYPLLVGGRPDLDFLLWPLVPASVSETNIGFLETFRALFARYAGELLAARVTPYLALELGLLGAVAALWLYDGMPPLRALVVRDPEDAR